MIYKYKTVGSMRTGFFFNLAYILDFISSYAKRNEDKLKLILK